MTYRSRGRSLMELVFATTFAGFLVGFVAVLCVGNYYRAKRAAERQKQRRLERQQKKEQAASMASLQYNPNGVSRTPSGMSGISVGASQFSDAVQGGNIKNKAGNGKNNLHERKGGGGTSNGYTQANYQTPSDHDEGEERLVSPGFMSV